LFVDDHLFCASKHFERCGVEFEADGRTTAPPVITAISEDRLAQFAIGWGLHRGTLRAAQLADHERRQRSASTSSVL
jgi:hypothetical protein